MPSMLDRQFKKNLETATDMSIVLAVADYARELGVSIPLTSDNFVIIQGFVEKFDISEDIFAYVEGRIKKLQKIAPILLRIHSNPFAFLSSAIFGPELTDEETELLSSLGRPSELDTLLLGVIISMNSRFAAAFKAAVDGSFKELQDLLNDEAIDVLIFGPDARETTWVSAVEEAVDYTNTLPLAAIIEPDVDPVLARYYVSYPGTDQRHVIDALISALFKREPEALRELLHKSGYTISRLPKKKTTDA